MKIHEYQAKTILSGAGVTVPRGDVATTPDKARQIAGDLGGHAVIKAQIHAGGRGKAGGVKVVSSPREAEQVAETMLGTKLVTIQTGSEGMLVENVLVEEVLEVDRELYVAVVIDGSFEGPIVIASEAGGMDIESVAELTPSKVVKIAIDPMIGLQSYQGRKISDRLNVENRFVRSMTTMVSNLYKVFEQFDCSLVEINPLVITKDDRILAADAKLSLDDDALFRHPNLDSLRDFEQEDALEARAQQLGVSYVKLDGDVGCIVNGAGLAMATMDVTGKAGAAPANFLDVGGSADEEKVASALKIILSDPSVAKVLVNIFGGILRCDIVARGILKATETTPHALRPMVVRMLGTNAEEGRAILSESNLNVTLVNDFTEAAKAIKALE